MTRVSYEITKEDFEKAKEQGARSLIGESIICGYGVYGAEVKEIDGKYYLSYERGDRCD